MAKVAPVNKNGTPVGYVFECPGCGSLHAPFVRPYQAPNGAFWDFNGDVNAPTFSPSILQKIDYTESGRSPSICHSYVTAGRIRYLSDCTHKLVGQEVELPDIDFDGMEE
jgi:hypothetical protein